MAFWDHNQWRTVGGSLKVIEPWDPNSIEDANYLLSVGNEVYVSDEESAKTARQLKEGESFAIDPGQFAFLLTEESVCIPFNTLGFISIRASIKFSGLVNISGFHVDPGYNGKLLFSVFNAGPSRIHLKRGAKIFPIWLADLHEGISKKEIKKGYDELPSKYINQISGKFTTAYQVEKHLDDLKNEIRDLKAFKTQALIVLTIAGALLIPTFKDAVIRIFHGPSLVSGKIASDLPTPNDSQIPGPSVNQATGASPQPFSIAPVSPAPSTVVK